MDSHHQQKPKKNRFKGCFFAGLVLIGLFVAYGLGLSWWTENTDAGQKHQAELKEQHKSTSTDFLNSQEPKSQQQRIDSAKLVGQKEVKNPELHLANLHKELENKTLTKVQREEIEIKSIISQKWANKNINRWDNSNPKLERAVKNVMNDKNSFEHVDTEYSYKKDKVVATMTYRGNNAFGTKVIEQVIGTLDYEGNLQSVE